MIEKYIRDAISKIRGNSFDREYRGIKNINNRNKLLQFQENHLKKLILHAYSYHRIFKEIGVVNDGIADLSKFNKIAILTKEIMREPPNELISNDYKTRKWYYNSSGGSTGEPTRFVQDDLYKKWGNVAFYYFVKLDVFLSRFLFSCSLESLVSKGTGRK